MLSKLEDQNSFDFQQYSLILKRRWLVIAVVTCSIFGITTLAALKQKPIYEAEGKLLFNKTNRVSSLTSLTEQVGELSGVTQLSKPLDTEAEVMRSNPIVAKTIDALELKDKSGKPLEIDEFLKVLKVKSIKDTDILALSYRSNNPQQAAAVVNALMGYYLDYNITNNRSEATAAREFLRKQLPDVESKVMRSETALRRFKEANKVVILEDEAKAGVASLKDLSDQITKATADLADANTRSGALQRDLELNKQQAITLNTLSQSPAVQQILAEYQKVQDQLVLARTRYTDEHPAIKNLSAQEIALRKQLELRVSQTLGSRQPIPQNLQTGELKQTLTAQLVQLEIERLALANRIAVLKGAYSLSQKRLSVLPQLEQKQLQLERQLQVGRSTYEQLLKRLQEVEVVVNQNVGNARVVSPALVPKKSVSPRITLNLALGGLLGILLGFATALLLEAMDKSLKTVEKAKQVLGYPLLGVIPRLNKKSSRTGKENAVELPVRDNPYSSASAAFEMLLANLDFTLCDQLLKVIVVLSSSPNEGKSFVAANLAVAKAHMGRRVLLVDADMRDPLQHVIWKLPNLMGLSNILAGQAELSTSTQKVLINLEVLNAGTIGPNPAALLDSQRMASLVEAAVRNYDFVIIDTPALNLFVDGLMLSKLADGILLTVRPGVLDSATATATKMLLEQSRAHVLGMVVNGVTGEHSPSYYHSKTYYGRKGSEMRA